MKLELRSPLASRIVTQRFGEKSPTYSGQGMPGHNGIDFRAVHGTPVFAAHAGTAYYDVDSNQGHGIVIITDGKYDYQGGECHFKTIYWHLCDPVREPRYGSPVQDFPWGKRVA